MGYRRVAYRHTVALTAGGVLWHTERFAYALGQPCWHPEADVYESGTAYTVTVALAGVEQDDLDVRLSEDGIAISGVRRAPAVEEDGVYRLARIPTGEFRLVLPLGGRVESAAVTAVHANGLLRIVVPKAPP